MAYNDKEASRFVTEMSERQISAREFFSVGLLDALAAGFRPGAGSDLHL